MVLLSYSMLLLLELLPLHLQDLEGIIAASGYLGPLIFAGSYAAATVLLFPASLLTLAAGYLFGEQSSAHCSPCHYLNVTDNSIA